MFELSKMLFEITFILSGYHVYKDIWGVKISSELPFYVLPEPDMAKIAMQQQSLTVSKQLAQLL